MNPTITLAPHDAPTRDAHRITRPGAASSARHFWRGKPEDSPLIRPALLLLLFATALLYLWGLGSSGWANSFYSAAAQAGSASWKAFFFGSSDAGNSITVDKTPMSLWAMALSVRLFGLSSWSILVPQALMGVASVGMLYATVRRSTHHAIAGLVAGAILALTPVAVLMFRFNNPDALLVLLLIASVAATLRALETPDRAVRWLVLAGGLIGFAFLTKMLQAFLVLPPLALVYLISARVSIPRRLGHLLIAFVSMVVAAGWWVAAVSLWPAASRPYIGGSTDNSILQLTLGYNGFGRLSGDETGSVGGGGGWGQTGLLRMFNTEIGTQISWLLPAALLLVISGLWFLRRTGRTDPRLSALIVWGGWLIVTGLTFSLMAGIFHAYYTVALAPAIAASVAIGSVILWQHRRELFARLCMTSAIALTSAWAYVLLDRTPTFLRELRWLIVIIGFASALGIVFLAYLRRRAAIAIAIATLIAALAGPAAYAADTASTPHTGSIPSAGPDSGRMGGPGGGGFRAGGQRPGGFGGGQRPTGQAGTGGRAAGAPGGNAGAPGGAPTMRGGAGGLLEGSQSTDAITKLLTTNASSYTWVAAAIGSNNAAGYQLASQKPVMPIGGFNGSDDSPTLTQFKQYVANGAIHYFIASGRGGAGPQARGGSSSAISTWIAANFTAKTVDGVRLYDLSGGIR